ATRDEASPRILHRPVMEIAVDIEACRHAGRGGLEHQSPYLHSIDIDGWQARGAAALTGLRRGSADRPPRHIRGVDTAALDMHPPGEERKRRPVKRDATSAQPHALGIAQLQTRDLDVRGKTPPEPGDAHASGCELRGFALE